MAWATRSIGEQMVALFGEPLSQFLFLLALQVVGLAPGLG
jgi:hypothetical protein